jgi:hypothetical protein
MGKFLYIGLALALLGLTRLYAADWSGATIPLLSAAPGYAVPESVKAVGTPAAVVLPESDPATWFEEVEDSTADTERWVGIAMTLAEAGTPAGWAAICKAAGSVAGDDRGASPELGALACSSDATVTELQLFAVQLLAAQAETTLWLRGIAGHDDGAVAARMGEVRTACAAGLPSRLPGEGSAYAEACAGPLAAVATAPLAGEALFEALGEAYGLVADDLAERDPAIDPEPPASKVAEDAEAADVAEATDAGDPAASDAQQ